METEENSQLPFLDTLIQKNSDNTISVKPTHTDQYIKLTSHHLARAKKSVITSLFDRAKNIFSNLSDQEKEENHLTAVLQADGYPKKFVNNTIRASQLPRQSANKDNTENQEQIAPVRINLPYVKGTSEQLKRIFNDDNINCTFSTATTHYVLFYHVQKILYLQNKETKLSISMTAKTVRLCILENPNELIKEKRRLRRLYKNTQDPNTKSTINKLQKEIRTKINQESTISWEKFCNSISLESDPKKSWRKITNFLKPKAPVAILSLN